MLESHSYAFKGVKSFVTQNYEELQNQNSNQFCDTIFCIGNELSTNNEIQEFQVIGALFAIHSKVFANMLFGKMQESQLNPISKTKTNININTNKKYVEINDITPNTFKYLISFCYGLNPIINESNVVNILYSANKYLINPLKQACIARISFLL